MIDYSPDFPKWQHGLIRLPSIVSPAWGIRHRAAVRQRSWLFRLVVVVLAVGVVRSAVFAESPKPTDGDTSLMALLDEDWEFEARENPLNATRTGDHRFDDLLPQISLQDAVRRLKVKEERLVRLEQIDRAGLSRENQLNFDMFRRVLRDEVQGYQFHEHLIPITNRSGFHIEFPDIRKQVPLRSPQDYENYISRLRQFRSYALGHIELMRAGIEQGYTLPSVVLEGYRDAITPHIVSSPEESLFFEPFRSFPSSVPSVVRANLIAAGSQAINEGIVAGYQAFLEFMEHEYVPAARGSIAASALPDGRDYYRFCVRKYTTLEITPDEIHQVGLREVARIRNEMDQIRQQVGFEGDFDHFLDYLRTDPKFYPQSAESLMKETAWVLKRMDGELPRLFKHLPKTPYGIREIPAYIAPQTSAAYYMPPAGDGIDAGFYYVNTFNLASRSLNDVQALSLHEAVPGHHLQIALQQELKHLPNFRRFGGVTVFVEGWGLYAERLGLEVGFYSDPYSNFGRLTYEMWRACRLVVDSGMHYLGWSRGDAIRYMEQNSGLSKHNIRAEVDRYIAWPGQALAYKTGELKIRELRALAERELGSQFDVRAFHDAVLREGAVPLDVLEQQVRGYIAQTLGSEAGRTEFGLIER